MSSFIPMTGPVRDVFELLENEIDFECSHEVCSGQDVCELTELTGLEEAAVRIAELIEKGEIS